MRPFLPNCFINQSLDLERRFNVRMSEETATSSGNVVFQPIKFVSYSVINYIDGTTFVVAPLVF